MVDGTDAVKFRVIGAGLGRTGTGSFKKALEILGLGPCYHMVEVANQKDGQLWDEYAEDPKNLKLLNTILAGSGYASSCDFPSAPFWREQMELYPDAKVILTARHAETWYKSCIDTIFQVQPSHPQMSFGVAVALWLGYAPGRVVEVLNKIIFTQCFNGNWNKANVIKCYNEFNRDVLETCPPEKLLVFEVSQGWKPLCAFLEVPVPNVPFPHVNDTKQFQRKVRNLSMIGYSYIGAGLLGLSVAALVTSRYVFGVHVPLLPPPSDLRK